MVTKFNDIFAAKLIFALQYYVSTHLKTEG